jgi:hypothetical protein
MVKIAIRLERQISGDNSYRHNVSLTPSSPRLGAAFGAGWWAALALVLWARHFCLGRAPRGSGKHIRPVHARRRGRFVGRRRHHLRLGQEISPRSATGNESAAPEHDENFMLPVAKPL